MSKIVEIYPDIESVEAQTEARKKFGWSYSVAITDRGVYEITFTRDDTTAKNKKLKQLEDDFDACCAAEDYIERYDRMRADKKKFRAYHPLMWIVIGYLLFMCIALAVFMAAFKVLYTTSPDTFYGLGLTFTTPDGTSALITPEWSVDLNLKELGLSQVLAIIGVNQPVLTVTVELIVNILFAIGIGSAVIALIIIIAIIRRCIRAKRYYKADVEYINRRKQILNDKIDDLEEEMDDIIDRVNAL